MKYHNLYFKDTTIITMNHTRMFVTLRVVMDLRDDGVCVHIEVSYQHGTYEYIMYSLFSIPTCSLCDFLLTFDAWSFMVIKLGFAINL